MEDTPWEKCQHNPPVDTCDGSVERFIREFKALQARVIEALKVIERLQSDELGPDEEGGDVM